MVIRRGAHPSAFHRLILAQKFRHRPSEVFGLLDVAEMPAALEHHEVGALDAGVQQCGPQMKSWRPTMTTVGAVIVPSSSRTVAGVCRSR
ncbi:hypothetical protein [Dactylosporangium cerinum]